MRLAAKLEGILDTTLLSAAAESCGSNFKGARKPRRGGVFQVNSDACAELCQPPTEDERGMGRGWGGVPNPYMQKVQSN